MFTRRNAAVIALASACLGLSACATLPGKPVPGDPLERMNRSVYAFNHGLDRAIVRPAARGYQAITPPVVRKGINNFFTNLTYPTTLVNDVLQLKPKAALTDTARLLLNTTLGFAGFLDPATEVGLPLNDEDFGQTLGYWGVPAGPYLMLPLFGPSSLRDAPGLAVDTYTDPRFFFNQKAELKWGLLALSLVDRRSRLLSADETLDKAYDPYAFIRNASRQRREYLVRDGEVAEEPPPEDPDAADDAVAPDDAAPAEQGTAPAEPPPGDVTKQK